MSNSHVRSSTLACMLLHCFNNKNLKRVKYAVVDHRIMKMKSLYILNMETSGVDAILLLIARERPFPGEIMLLDASMESVQLFGMQYFMVSLHIHGGNAILLNVVELHMVPMILAGLQSDVKMASVLNSVINVFLGITGQIR